MRSLWPWVVLACAVAGCPARREVPKPAHEEIQEPVDPFRLEGIPKKIGRASCRERV